ncbi:MAG: hypothetical protein JXA06_02225 [Bacteroidetes bacterium]|nr:hypothetical protein [Bacteroidota bacterium]
MVPNKYRMNLKEESSQIFFRQHPTIKWKIRLFLIFFFIGGLLLLFGVDKLSEKENINPFTYIALIGMFIIVIDVLTIIIFLKCPKCRTRVFSVKMMWYDKMPLGRNDLCPICRFPNSKSGMELQQINKDIKFTYPWFCGGGMQVILFNFSGVFCLYLLFRGIESFPHFFSFIMIILSVILAIILFMLLRKMTIQFPINFIIRDNKLIVLMLFGARAEFVINDIKEIKDNRTKTRKGFFNVSFILKDGRIMIISRYLIGLDDLILKIKNINPDCIIST